MSQKGSFSIQLQNNAENALKEHNTLRKTKLANVPAQPQDQLIQRPTNVNALAIEFSLTKNVFVLKTCLSGTVKDV